MKKIRMLLKFSNKIIITVAVLIVLFVFLFLPLDFPYNVKTLAKLLPAKEWIVTKTAGGELITILNDNKTGLSNNFTISQFERGDAVWFNFKPGLKPGSSVKEQDTVGALYSNEIERQLASLKGELAAAKASLEFNLHGEKTAIVQEAEKQLEYQKRQAEEHEKILTRLKSLYERDLISTEEYEIAQGTAALNKISIDIAEAQLKSVRTGAKQEQIDLIRSQIKALEDQINILESRLADYNLVSPISGKTSRYTSGDTLLIVSDTTEFIMILPVPVEEKKYISKGTPVEMDSPSRGELISGTILDIDNRIQYLSGGQFVVAIAAVNNTVSEPLSGFVGRAKIQCDSITAKEHLIRLFN